MTPKGVGSEGSSRGSLTSSQTLKKMMTVFSYFDPQDLRGDFRLV